MQFSDNVEFSHSFVKHSVATVMQSINAETVVILAHFVLMINLRTKINNAKAAKIQCLTLLQCKATSNEHYIQFSIMKYVLTWRPTRAFLSVKLLDSVVLFKRFLIYAPAVANSFLPFHCKTLYITGKSCRNNVQLQWWLRYEIHSGASDLYILNIISSIFVWKV